MFHEDMTSELYCPQQNGYFVCLFVLSRGHVMVIQTTHEYLQMLAHAGQVTPRREEGYRRTACYFRGSGGGENVKT